MLNHHHLPPDRLPEGKGESRGAAVVEGRGGVGQAEAEDGGHRHEEEGQGGEEEGKLKQDFNIDCLNIIMTAFIFFFMEMGSIGDCQIIRKGGQEGQRKFKSWQSSMRRTLPPGSSNPISDP